MKTRIMIFVQNKLQNKRKNIQNLCFTFHGKMRIIVKLCNFEKGKKYFFKHFGSLNEYSM